MIHPLLRTSSQPALGPAFVRVRVLPLLALALVALLAAPGEAQITGVPVLGKIEYIFLDDPNDPWSSGTIIVEGTPVTIPRNLLIDLPANRMTLWQLFQDAPPGCVATGETGLAMTDVCLEGRGGGQAVLLANRMPSGHLIAGDVFIAKDASGELEGGLIPVTAGGYISYIDHTEGYLVLNGTMGVPPVEDGGPATNQGFIVRFNDPDGVHSVQQGLGCDGGPNCSPDPRFTNDPENYTICYSNGYPLCLPSTVTGIGARTVGSNAAGVGDPFCPSTNRLLGGPSGLESPNSRRFMPLQLGDKVSGEGNWEVINGVRFFSTHTFGPGRLIATRRTADQPDYMTMAEVEWDAPGFQNHRNKSLFIGFTTLEDSPVELYSLAVDPDTNENHEFPLGSTQGNLDTNFQGTPPTAGFIFKIGYDVDFDLGAPVVPGHSPCQNLLNAGFAVCPNGGTMEEEFSIVSPVTREIIGRSLHRAELLPGNEPRDIRGSIANYGQYLTPIGVGHPEWGEINVDAMSTGFIFAGEPWNIDRRLAPGGCLDENANGVCDDNAPIGALALDPFPFSELDPRTQAPVPVFASNRIFAHFPFGPNDLVPFPPTAPDPNVLVFAFAAAPGNRCSIPNEVPVAQNDGAGGTIATDEDTALLIAPATILANDNDADLDTLTIYAADAASSQGGLVALQADQSLLYTPAPDFNGADSFAYFISDGHGGTDIALVTVTVLPVNDDPVAAADDLMTPINTNLVITGAALLSNDSDVDGDTLSVASVAATGSEGGSITPTGPNWTYNPDNNTVGLETFTYDLSDGNGGTSVGQLRIHVGNNAPNAVNDAVSTPEDVARTILATTNDTDSDGDSLTITGFTQGTRGTVSQIGPASLLFTPDPNDNGSDSFTYSITDSRGGHDTATVSMSITAVNDPPIAVADFATTLEDTTVLINVRANDTDPEGTPLIVTLDPALPADGFAAQSIDVIGNQIRYVPLPDVALPLPDVFSYRVSDGVNLTTGVVSVVVQAVNDAPVALDDIALTIEDQPVTLNPLANDLDIENDTLRIQSVSVPPGFPASVVWDPLGSLTFTPQPNFSNAAGVTISYTSWDGHDTDVATITLVVLPVNDAPVANNDLGFVTQEDTVLTIPVLANDSDADGNPITIFSTTSPIRGTVTILASGQIRYTPNPNATGNDVFQYTITDNAGGSDNATVSLTITPVNDPPVVNNDGPVPLAEDTVKFIATSLLFANDIDVDGDALTLLSATTPLHGTTALVTGAGGVVTGINYTPAANYSGPDSFTYAARDPSGASDTALVTLQVLAVNDPPVANNDFLVVNQNSSATATPLANDTDADGNPLTIAAILVAPLHGSAVVNAGGTIIYTPVTGYFGVDHLVYQASDGAGGTDSASVDIVVQQVVSPTTAFIRGDANTDGSINVVDPIQTLFVLFESATPICLVAHDSNDDDQVDVGDIMFSLNFIFSSGQQPGAPYIFCGEDPSAGALDCDNFGVCQ